MSRVEDRLWAVAMGVSGVVALIGFALKLTHHLPAGTAWPGLAGLACALILVGRSWRATALKRGAS